MLALEEAVGWVRGSFLDALSIRNSPPFEEWVLINQERIKRQVVDAYGWLAADCERRGRYEEARDWVRRQLELEPLDEDLHRDLMRCVGAQRAGKCCSARI